MFLAGYYGSSIYALIGIMFNVNINSPLGFLTTHGLTLLSDSNGGITPKSNNLATSILRKPDSFGVKSLFFF